MASLVERLLARPGIYVGRGDGIESGEFVGRIAVAVLPSGSGVAIDYEALSVGELLQHAEHSVLAPGPGGLTLVVAHSESPAIAVMVEQRDGFFVDSTPDAPYQRAIEITAPAPETITYAWWWSPPGEDLVERSKAVVQLSP